MVDFLISYKNNVAKIGRRGSRITSENGDRILTEDGNYIVDSQDITFKLRSFNVPAAILTENNNYLVVENDTFLVWDIEEESSLVYRFLGNDLLPSPEIDTDRIVYGD